MTLFVVFSLLLAPHLAISQGPAPQDHQGIVDRQGLGNEISQNTFMYPQSFCKRNFIFQKEFEAFPLREMDLSFDFQPIQDNFDNILKYSKLFKTHAEEKITEFQKTDFGVLEKELIFDQVNPLLRGKLVKKLKSTNWIADCLGLFESYGKKAFGRGIVINNRNDLRDLRDLQKTYNILEQVLEVKPAKQGFRSSSSGTLLIAYTSPNNYDSYKDGFIFTLNNNTNIITSKAKDAEINALCVGNPVNSQSLNKKKANEAASNLKGTLIKIEQLSSRIQLIQNIFSKVPQGSIQDPSPILVPPILNKITGILRKGTQSQYWQNLDKIETQELDQMTTLILNFLRTFKTNSRSFNLVLGKNQKDLVSQKLGLTEQNAPKPLARYSPFRRNGSSMEGNLLVQLGPSSHPVTSYRIMQHHTSENKLTDQFLTYFNGLIFSSIKPPLRTQCVDSLGSIQYCKITKPSYVNSRCGEFLMGKRSDARACSYSTTPSRASFELTPRSLCLPGSTDLVLSSVESGEVSISCQGHVRTQQLKAKEISIIKEALGCDVRMGKGPSVGEILWTPRFTGRSPVKNKVEHFPPWDSYQNSGQDKRTTVAGLQLWTLILIIGVVFILLLLFSLIIMLIYCTEISPCARRRGQGDCFRARREVGRLRTQIHQMEALMGEREAKAWHKEKQPRSSGSATTRF